VRAFILRLIGHFPQIADDRIGSRVAERAFATADPFLKDKIAASVFDHQEELQRSAYAHFLARKMELPLWGRKREEWKLKMGRLAAEEKARAAGRAVPAATAAAPAPAPVVSKKRERRTDDIDEIFKTGTAPASAPKESNGAGGDDEERAAKRARKEARRAEKAAKKASSNGEASTEGLGDVLAAIKATV
jgi:nucleolar protein 9